MEETKPTTPSTAARPTEIPTSDANGEAVALPAKLEVISAAAKTDDEVEAKVDVASTRSTTNPSSVAERPVVGPNTTPRPRAKTADLVVADAKPRPAKAVSRIESVPSDRRKSAARSSKRISNSLGRKPVKAAGSHAAPAQSKLKAPRIKEKIMATKTDTKAAAFTADIQEKASAVFQKGSALVGEIGIITKGNLAATTQSGKIVLSGLQQLGTGYVAEGRAAFETLSADVRELAATKSPLDFLKLQSQFVRRNFEAALAFGSKNSKDIVKLAQDASAPLVNQTKAVVKTARKGA
jgi:hypothetical protein